MMDPTLQAYSITVKHIVSGLERDHTRANLCIRDLANNREYLGLISFPDRSDHCNYYTFAKSFIKLCKIKITKNSDESYLVAHLVPNHNTYNCHKCNFIINPLIVNCYAVCQTEIERRLSESNQKTTALLDDVNKNNECIEDIKRELSHLYSALSATMAALRASQDLARDVAVRAAISDAEHIFGPVLHYQLDFARKIFAAKIDGKPYIFPESIHWKYGDGYLIPPWCATVVRYINIYEICPSAVEFYECSRLIIEFRTSPNIEKNRYKYCPIRCSHSYPIIYHDHVCEILLSNGELYSREFVNNYCNDHDTKAKFDNMMFYNNDEHPYPLLNKIRIIIDSNLNVNNCSNNYLDKITEKCFADFKPNEYDLELFLANEALIAEYNAAKENTRDIDIPF